MPTSWLLRKANTTDIKRAIANPRKAYRSLQRHTWKRTTATGNDDKLTSDQINSLSAIFDQDEEQINTLINDLREGQVPRRIKECENYMKRYPFSLGGMGVGGETAYVAMRLLKSQTVFEVGVANGLSTLYLLKAADHVDINPNIHAVDKPRFENDVIERRGKRGLRNVGGIIPDSKEAAWVAPVSLRQAYNYQYYVGDFTEVLPSLLEEIDPLELALYDASKDKSEMKTAFETLLERLNDGGVLISDDIDRNNAFETICSKYDGQSVLFNEVGVFRKGV